MQNNVEASVTRCWEKTPSKTLPTPDYLDSFDFQDPKLTEREELLR